MDHNILVVSEKDQKAYLPYFDSDIEEIYKHSNNLYQSKEEIINDLYILPLDRFKNASMSRFRETLNLLIHKEKKSFLSSLDLALELMFKYELNPIIIAACRNLDELDIYLDCLEENELFDFTCFKIRFEITPDIYREKLNRNKKGGIII